MSERYQADVAVVGAGIAGIVTALELLDQNRSVILLDRNGRERFGGLANEAFGGMLLTGTPIQKRNGIEDSPELTLRDWENAAEFGEHDHWPKEWAKTYAYRNHDEVYLWLKDKGIRFFPAVNWVERGDYGQGNSVPRYHIVWGTGRGLTQTLIQHLENHRNRARLKLLFGHKLEELNKREGRITGGSGQCANGQNFELHCDQLVLACGGINGNLDKVREVWDPCYGPAPDNLLNGSHPSADGLLHEQVSKQGGRVTHLEWMWNYAAGIEHPDAEFEHQGLSLIPPRSALWVDCYGRRIGPKPMVTGFDTHDLCKQLGKLDHQYSWQVMNWKIAVKEMAISGADMNPSFRDKKLFRFLKEILMGNTRLVQWMVDQCPDVLVANSLPELAQKMNALTEQPRVSPELLMADISAYDAQIERGESLHNDDQLRRIAQLRQWRGDKVRTCKFQKINDPKAGPFIAIRERLISRKSMGGMQTNLSSQVLDLENKVIEGLYAVGEAAGFGGGGISGIRSLEGTFLSSCILTAKIAAGAIVGSSTSRSGTHSMAG